MRRGGSQTVTKPWVLLWSSQGNRTLGKRLGVLGSDSGGGGQGKGGEGEVVNYTSIPHDAPRPQRYLFCQGNGRGPETLHVACRDGYVPAMGWGVGEEERFCGVLSLAKVWTEVLRDSAGSLSGTSEAPGLSAPCSPSLRVSAPGCSSYSQAEL